MQNYLKVTKVVFPSFTGINVNMMPIIIGDDSSIPKHLLPYLEMINKCYLPVGSTAYLTIRESLVTKGNTQSRPGIHVEAPAMLNWGGGAWGLGKLSKYNTPEDGIYLAINDTSCMIWDEYIENRGKLGEVSPSGKGKKLIANQMYWFTDKTPHAALPVDEDTYRQLFRLVAEPISVWYTQHNTANPLGVEPTCFTTDINKFEKVL